MKGSDKRKPLNQKFRARNRNVSPARLAAFEILLKIEKEQAFSSVLLPIYEEKLETKDRGLCHELVLGVLRKKFFLDRVAQKFIKQNLERLDTEVLISLRLGIYQMLFLDKIPVFAAINESVNLVHHAKKTSASGLVNAVLRKIEREKRFSFDFKDDLEKLAFETSHPRWLLENWVKSFGFEETSALAAANNVTPNLVFRLTSKSNEKTVEILKKLGLEIEESKIVSGAWRVIKGNEMLHVYAAEGEIYFQEESSQLVALAVELKENEKFLDVCAAPGSKTTLVGKNNKGKNNLIIAGDRYTHRLRVLQENCRRVGEENVLIAAYDAEKYLPFAENTFDCVLVDAPCSGTGTIRHNPEIRYFLQSKDFEELPSKQLKILKNASKVLKQGGRLIYSTCSLEIAENENVIENFLAENSDFQKISLDLPQQFLTSEGYARTFPHRDSTDGFFIACLLKV